MKFDELVKLRRSVRAYQPGKTVERETLEAILNTALLAPTWKNTETGRYYVAVTPEAMEGVRACLFPGNQGKSVNACALIVTTFVRNVSGHTNGQPDNEFGNQWGAYDLGLQNAYLVLKARELGLDTLIMGLRDADGLRTLLNIPETEDVAAVISVGYRDEEPALRPRKELAEVAKFF